MDLATIIFGLLALLLPIFFIRPKKNSSSTNNSQKARKSDDLAVEEVRKPSDLDTKGASKFCDPIECRKILSCEPINELRLENRTVPTKSRARPNERLIHVFEIDNAFTTSDDQYRKNFRASAAKKLQAIDDEKWNDIAKLARELIGRWREKDHREGIYLVKLVQTVAMSISLYALFDHLNPLELEESVVSQAANCINELWILSKEIPLDGVLVAAKKSGLQGALKHISPDFKFTQRENPLNFILPAYETLWWVVLRCFIEVSFRNIDSREEWRRILQDFCKNPSGPRFKGFGGDADLSVNFIVSEALRLYPPTSRVYRECYSGEGSSQIVAADIESCQRNEVIWGRDSKLFKPSRWNKLSDEAKKAFMPFGGGGFICPARETFGPRMIGVLVAVLASEFSSDYWKIGYGENYEGAVEYEWPSGPLESGRRAFESLKLWKKF